MSSPRWAAPTWSELVSAQATSRSAGVDDDLAAIDEPAQADGLVEGTDRARCRARRCTSRPVSERRRTISAMAPSSTTVARDQRGDLTGGDPGEQLGLLLVGAAQQQGAGRDGRREQGRRRQVAAQLLEDHGRLDQRGPEAVVLLGDGEGRHAHLLAHRLPQRLVVPRVRLHGRADRRAVAALVQQRRHDGGELVLLLGAGEVHQPRASAIRPRWYDEPPHAPTSARTRLIQSPRSNSAV